MKNYTAEKVHVKLKSTPDIFQNSANDIVKI